MNLLQRLKIETALAHDRIEQAFDLGARTSSRSAYRDLLARLYGFHAAWEPRAEAALAHAGFFHGRRKVDLLIADLHELGMTDRDMGQLALCVPYIDPKASASVRTGTVGSNRDCLCSLSDEDAWRLCLVGLA